MLAYNCRSGPLAFTNSAKLHLGYDGWYNKEKQVRVCSRLPSEASGPPAQFCMVLATQWLMQRLVLAHHSRAKSCDCYARHV